MIKKERNRARPRITCVGGIFWVPIACRTKPRTMTILVKHVVISRIAGATERIVSRNNTCSAFDTWSGVFASSTPKVIVGSPTAPASFVRTKKEQKNMKKSNTMGKAGCNLLVMIGFLLLLIATLRQKTIQRGE
jgi:hypothetical protein